mmetsp:Transcript_90211/g.291645  ORF Transcript_90211/g.291645 Transcript_90211/m.291645 type:complete len:448 (-) Transcript_90211:6170-7513(-)
MDVGIVLLDEKLHNAQVVVADRQVQGRPRVVVGLVHADLALGEHGIHLGIVAVRRELDVAADEVLPRRRLFVPHLLHDAPQVAGIQSANGLAHRRVRTGAGALRRCSGETDRALGPAHLLAIFSTILIFALALQRLDGLHRAPPQRHSVLRVEFAGHGKVLPAEDGQAGLLQGRDEDDILHVEDERHLSDHLSRRGRLGEPGAGVVDNSNTAGVQDHKLFRRLTDVRQLRVLANHQDPASRPDLDQETFRTTGENFRLNEVVQKYAARDPLPQGVWQSFNRCLHSLSLDQLARLFRTCFDFQHERNGQISALQILIDNLAHGLRLDGCFVSSNDLIDENAIAIAIDCDIQQEHGTNPTQLHPTRCENIPGGRLPSDSPGAPIKAHQILPPKRCLSELRTKGRFPRSAHVGVRPTASVGGQTLLIEMVRVVEQELVLEAAPSRPQHPP